MLALSIKLFGACPGTLVDMPEPLLEEFQIRALEDGTEDQRIVAGCLQPDEPIPTDSQIW